MGDITEGRSVKGKKEGTHERALGYSIGSNKASVKLLSNLTYCLWFLKHDLIHHNTVSSTPNKSLRQSKRMLWSMVSNAAGRSSNVSATALPESIKVAISFRF